MNNIAIVIPTHNRCEDLRNILDQIYNQRIVDEISLTPIVVVDGSSDGTKVMLKNCYPDIIQIIGDGSWWYTKSINEGIKYSLRNNFDFILTMNDDCLIDENYVTKILQDYKKIPNNSIIGSISFSVEQPTRIIFSGVKEIIWWRYKVKYYINKNVEVDPDNLDGIKESQSLPGRGILIPSKIIREIGLFDENFIQYGSDSDFIFRALKNNINVYVSWNAKVFTYLSKTGKGSIHSKESVSVYMKNYLDKYSRNYIGNLSRIIWVHGYKVLFPITLSIKLLGHLKNYLTKSE